MSNSAANLGGDPQPGRDPFLADPQARLRPGDRFPNFVLADQDGVFRSFVQRGRGWAQLILLDPDDALARSFVALAETCAAAELECIAILPASASAAGLPFLVDQADKIRPALRAMSGHPPASPGHLTPLAFLLDRNQRVIAIAPGNSGPDDSGPDNFGPDNFGPDNSGLGDLAQWALAVWERHRNPAPAGLTGGLVGEIAPVLTVPNVLSPEHCAALIERWHSHGHEAGSVSSLVQGEPVRRVYEDMKRRTDHRITDAAVWKPLTALIARRLGPELDKAFHYRNYRFDRLVVVCYDSERGDYFRRHRDNQTPENASRRFAVTINLNSDAYEGGELIFPEYGGYRYKPPAGGAILFSCSLLHEALPVTRGRRFALLTFLRDLEGREAT